MFVLIKILLSAIVIGIVTEISRRIPAYGGMLAALPLVSLISIIWLKVQGEAGTDLSKFALGVLAGFPATAVMLVVVYYSLKHAVNLYLSILMGLTGWIVFLILQEAVLRYVKQTIMS
ncbi:hypothetical protein ERJ70_07055 [Sediminibacillus dalangtanensis]|uniref:DUF3147 family protein n=1 Tax=Sediminibacillus dalangtanensis TaxID=2729421 RepID=A0ABX7VQA2_9BACI|nr:DUF3147 family protein [Sediminibacillus dalangtanensis]QTM99079.1 hypothetical protein ERJ70_07055 [Sediminibacillus dalangtanensis]